MNIAFMKKKTASLSVEDICQEILFCKKEEADAKQRRYELETMLANMVEQKEEGTAHAEADGYKVTVSFKLDRKVDAAAVQKAWSDLPSVVQEAFTWKPDLSIRQYRALESANPDAFNVLARYITTKPAKPAIKIEEV